MKYFENVCRVTQNLFPDSFPLSGEVPYIEAADFLSVLIAPPMVIFSAHLTLLLEKTTTKTEN